MKKFILATATATLGVALALFVAYIAYLDRCLEDDEANDGGDSTEPDDEDSDKDFGNQESPYNGFDTKPYMDIFSHPPCENIENPAPDEKSMETRVQEFMNHLDDDDYIDE